MSRARPKYERHAKSNQDLKKLGKFAGSQEAINRLIESNQRMKEANCSKSEGAEFQPQQLGD